MVGPGFKLGMQLFQVLFQPGCKVLKTLMVRARTASVRLDPDPGHPQGLHPDDLVNQAEPDASFHPLLEGFLHAFCLNRTFHPIPFLRTGVSRLLSHTAHWHGCGFVRGKHNSSTFLRPLAPPALPDFFATMGALTPVRPANRPCAGQVSLVHMTRPSLHSVTNHLTRSTIALLMPSQRDGLPGATSDSVTAQVWASHTASRLAATPGRIVFVILRTTGSFTVALHPASRQRSYFQLPGEGISRKRTFTSQITPASRRTGRPRVPGSAPPGLHDNLHDFGFADKVNHFHHLPEVGNSFGAKILQNGPPSRASTMRPALINALLGQCY